MNNKNSTTIAAIFTIAVLAMGMMQFAAAGGNETKLEGKFNSVDDGKAKFESKDGRMTFSVEIIDANLADGDYTIAVEGTSFSEIRSASAGILELDLDSQCKDGPIDNNCWINPPLDGFSTNDVVTVTGPTGSLVASATLQNK
ncbi:MAG: hypothetical protein ACT4NJ_07900 [Nitrosopumilaceae archaeon]